MCLGAGFSSSLPGGEQKHMGMRNAHLLGLVVRVGFLSVVGKCVCMCEQLSVCVFVVKYLCACVCVS